MPVSHGNIRGEITVSKNIVSAEGGLPGREVLGKGYGAIDSSTS